MAGEFFGRRDTNFSSLTQPMRAAWLRGYCQFFFAPFTCRTQILFAITFLGVDFGKDFGGYCGAALG
jgi:hypothetical protein